jgi:hypothetical protein
MPLIKELIGSAKQYYASVEYAITYIPTYPCGSIGLLVCRKAFGGDAAGTRGGQDAACQSWPPINERNEVSMNWHFCSRNRSTFCFEYLRYFHRVCKFGK